MTVLVLLSLVFLFLLLFVVAFVLRIVASVRSAIKQTTDAFMGNSSNDRPEYAESEFSSSIGQTELGHHRLQVLKSRADDVLFEEVTANS